VPNRVPQEHKGSCSSEKGSAGWSAATEISDGSINREKTLALPCYWNFKL
jgi:hypothetical protein